MNANKKIKCCLCGKEIEKIKSNSALPVAKGRCCDACNEKYVIPARLALIEINELEKGNNTYE